MKTQIFLKFQTVSLLISTFRLNSISFPIIPSPAFTYPSSSTISCKNKQLCFGPWCGSYGPYGCTLLSLYYARISSYEQLSCRNSGILIGCASLNSMRKLERLLPSFHRGQSYAQPMVSTQKLRNPLSSSVLIISLIYHEDTISERNPPKITRRWSGGEWEWSVDNEDHSWLEQKLAKTYSVVLFFWKPHCTLS